MTRMKKMMNIKKEGECPDDTSPIDIEEGVSDIKYDNNEKMMRNKRHNSQMNLTLLIWRTV